MDESQREYTRGGRLIVIGYAKYKKDGVFITYEGADYIGIDRIPENNERVMVINRRENEHGVYTVKDLDGWHKCSIRVFESDAVFCPGDFVVLKKA
jgi:hypothetical protein